MPPLLRSNLKTIDKLALYEVASVANKTREQLSPKEWELQDRVVDEVLTNANAVAGPNASPLV